MVPDRSGWFAAIALAVVVESPAEDGQPPASRVITGRVIDERSLPVAGAKVVARSPELLLPLEAITGAEGRFRFAVPVAPYEVAIRFGSEVLLVATTADGRIGLGGDWFLGREFLEREREVGPITLAPAGTLEVAVRDSNGVVAGAEVALQWSYRSNPIVSATTGSDGVARIDPAPLGHFVLFVRKSGRGRTVRTIDLGSGGTTAVAELRPTRTLTIDVIDSETRAPISGARVTVERQADGPNPLPGGINGGWEHECGRLPVTDAAGRVVIADLEAESRVVLRAEAPHYADPFSADFVPNYKERTGRDSAIEVVSAETGLVRLALRKMKTRRVGWQIVPADAPRPPDGTALRLSPAGQESRGAPRAAWMHGTVHDGAIQVEIDVWSGAEAAETRLPETYWAESSDGWIAELIPTEDRHSGTARFERGATLTVRRIGLDGKPMRSGVISIDAESSDELSTYRAPSEQQQEVDESGIARFASLHRGRWIVSGEGASHVVDLTRGDLSCDLTPLPTEPLTIDFVLAGKPCLPSDLFVSTSGAEWFTLRRAETERGRLHLVLVRADAGTPHNLTLCRPGKANLTLPLALNPSGAARTIAIDLDAMQPEKPLAPNSQEWVTWPNLPVTWVVPDGENCDFLALEPLPFPNATRDWGAGADSDWPFAPDPNPCSNFRFDPAHPPKLRVRHPYLVSSKWNDAIDLTKPRQAITLHMELGPLVTLTPELPDGTPPIRGVFATIGDDAPFPVLRRGEQFVFPPPEAGTQRLVLDPVVAAPVEIANVPFTGSAQELGTIRFPCGSTLRIHARAAMPFVAPIVHALATRLDGVPYRRRSSSTRDIAAPGELEVRGLGRGRFAIELDADLYGCLFGYQRKWCAEVEVDGEHDAELTIDVD